MEAARPSRSFVELIAAEVIQSTSRGEIPPSTTEALAGHLSASFFKSLEALSVGDPSEALKAAFGVDGQATEKTQAAQVARTIKAALGILWPSSFDQRAPATDEDPSGPVPAAEPEESSATAIYADRQELFDDLEAFEDKIESQASGGTGRPSRWQFDKVEQTLLNMLYISREWGIDDPDREEKYPHRVRFENALSLEIELQGLEHRHTLAQELARQALLNPDFSRPGKSAGNDVHTELQTRYLAHRSSHNVIVQEWRVAFPGRRYRPTISEQAEKELRNPDPKKRDFTFAVIEKARLPKRGRLNGRERWDTLDLRLAQLWEIKPLVNLPEGVLQESYYRFKYCYCALMLLDPEINCRVLVPWIEPGDDFPINDPSGRQTWIETRYGRIALPIKVTAELPGLVPYVVLRRTGQTDMVKLLIAVMAWIKAVYAEVKRIALELLAELIVTILVILLIVLLAVIVLVILAKALEEAVAPPKQLPDPGSAQPVPIEERKRETVPKLGSVGGFVSVRPAQDAQSLRLIMRGPDDASRKLQLGFGAVQIEGLPVSQFGEFLTKFTDALDVALVHLSRMPRQGSDRVV